jgi:hypothetical protein
MAMFWCSSWVHEDTPPPRQIRQLLMSTYWCRIKFDRRAYGLSMESDSHLCLIRQLPYAYGTVCNAMCTKMNGINWIWLI